MDDNCPVSSSEDELTDDDRRILIDMSSRWEPDSSSEDDDEQEQELRHLQSYQEKNNLSHIGKVSFEETSETEEQDLDMETRRKMRAVRSTRAMGADAIRATLSFKCCKLNCLCQFTFNEIKHWRSGFWIVSEAERRQSLLNDFARHLYHDGSKRKYSFNINGRPVCCNAWYKSFGISRSWFYSLLKEFENGRVSGQCARKGVVWRTARMHRAIMWFKNHVERSADYMPHENRICLPSCQSKTDVYNMYKADILAVSEHDRPVVWSSFRSMWKTYYSNVIIPKQNKFTKCGVCTLLKHGLTNTRNQDKREILATKRRIHLQQQSAERDHYYGNRLKAELEPRKFLSIILDGMDQAKTNIPHVTSISKTEPSHFVKTHITGAICHGQKKVFCYIDLLQWKHDTNLTLNVLLRVLAELIEDGPLPEILMIQMDNCYRENKNKYTMAFAALLVEAEIFKEVHMSFLMVGHTHEDIDQCFSRIAIKLKKKNAITVPELHDIVRESYTPTPESKDVTYMFDISGWLAPNIPPIKNHVYPHTFKFYLGEDKRAKMVYKNWAQDEEWLPSEGPLSVLTSIPKGTPSLIRPCLGGKQPTPLGELENTIKASSHRMTDEQMNWWTNFTREEAATRERWDTYTAEDLKRLAKEKWILQKLGKYYTAPQPDQTDPEILRQEKELQRLLEKENSFPPIQVSKKRKKNESSSNKTKKARITKSSKEMKRPGKKKP